MLSWHAEFQCADVSESGTTTAAGPDSCIYKDNGDCVDQDHLLYPHTLYIYSIHALWHLYPQTPERTHKYTHSFCVSTPWRMSFHFFFVFCLEVVCVSWRALVHFAAYATNLPSGGGSVDVSWTFSWDMTIFLYISVPGLFLFRTNVYIASIYVNGTCMYIH